MSEGRVRTWVWVHGYLGSSRIWHEAFSVLSKHHNIVTVDLPGFGSRSNELAPDSISQFASGVLGQLADRGLDTFGLMGHSMGGQIAQEMAIQAGERVKALVLYGTGPVGAMPGRFETIARSRERLAQDGVEATARRISARWFVDLEQAKDWPWVSELANGASLATADRCLKAMEQWNRERELGQIQCPTQIVWGESDRSYAWSEQMKLWQGIAQISLAVLPRCSHAAHLEAPELFQRVVGDFMRLHTA